MESSSGHSGGEATCKDKAVCSDCGESYGSLDGNNHVSSELVYVANPDDATKHDRIHSCCGLVESSSVHSGGAATLSERAICEICNEKYGDLATPGLDYTLSGDGTYYIVSGIGNCTHTDIVIPAIYEELPVKEIQLAAFSYSDITSVIIPEGVTSIGPRAFEHCYDLVSVTIPNSVTGINDYTFNGCKSLSYIKIGNGVTYIGVEAFTSCIILNSITLPESLERIGSKAFSYCYRLTSITIPEKVEEIEANAFFTCPRLVEVINHSHINVKADSAFEIHNGDTSKIDNVDGYLFYTHEGTNYLISYIGQDTELILPADYKGEEYVIYDQAFYSFRNVTSITISEGVKSIGLAAFAFCRELVSITIPGSVESIGDSAIRYCDSFTDVYFTGTEEEWATISIGSYNDTLTGATIHYNYVPEE